MDCPECGNTDMVDDIRDMPYTYQQKTTIFPKVSAIFCDDCGESLLNMSESRRVMELMLGHKNTVDGIH